MRIITIPKKNGKSRTIYVPDPKEKKSIKAHLPSIADKASKACPENVAHGFTTGRSPVTNALQHVNRQYTTCFDLSDFFDSVTASHVEGMLTDEELSTCFVDGAPRQGLPTSPSVANLAAAIMDRTILQWKTDHSLDFVYTRYADDLSFSYDDPNYTAILLEVIPQIVESCKFRINPSKTRTQCARSGRRMITGVAVDDTVYSPRKQRRRLRAAKHQRKTNIVHGLGGWCSYIDSKRWNRTELDRLMSEIFGGDLRHDRSARFTSEGGGDFSNFVR